MGMGTDGLTSKYKYVVCAYSSPQQHAIAALHMSSVPPLARAPTHHAHTDTIINYAPHAHSGVDWHALQEGCWPSDVFCAALRPAGHEAEILAYCMGCSF